MDAPKKSSLPVIPRENLVPFLLLTVCFALWGMGHAMNDLLVPSFSLIFIQNASESSMAHVAFYLAYSFLAIPTALFIKKYSYKAGVLLGLGVYAFGTLGFIPSAAAHFYEGFLISIFVLACGLSIMETTCNPYIMATGPEETGIRRLNLAQAFNPLGGIVGVYLVKAITMTHLHSDVTLEERALMNPQELSALQSSELYWLAAPYVLLFVIGTATWITVAVRKMPVGADTEHTPHFVKSAKNLLSNRRYCTGVIAQFFNVGMQISIWTWIVKYVMAELQVVEHVAANYLMASMVAFIVMRMTCTALMKRFNPASMMALMAVLAIACTLVAMFAHGYVGIYSMVGISGCIALMFPTIYGIAVKDLGSDSKLGSAGLIIAVIGGAAIPPLQALMIDHVGLRESYWVPILCMAVILCYALRYRKSAQLPTASE